VLAGGQVQLDHIDGPPQVLGLLLDPVAVRPNAGAEPAMWWSCVRMRRSGVVDFVRPDGSEADFVIEDGETTDAVVAG
jgi:hypothetical protein